VRDSQKLTLLYYYLKYSIWRDYSSRERRMGRNLLPLGLFDGGSVLRELVNFGNWLKKLRGRLIVVHLPRINWNGLGYLPLSIRVVFIVSESYSLSYITCSMELGQRMLLGVMHSINHITVASTRKTARKGVSENRLIRHYLHFPIIPLS
jgi:hypothetical protein